jgi:hypothetical protein
MGTPSTGEHRTHCLLNRFVGPSPRSCVSRPRVVLYSLCVLELVPWSCFCVQCQVHGSGHRVSQRQAGSCAPLCTPLRPAPLFCCPHASRSMSLSILTPLESHRLSHVPSVSLPLPPPGCTRYDLEGCDITALADLLKSPTATAPPPPRDRKDPVPSGPPLSAVFKSLLGFLQTTLGFVAHLPPLGWVLKALGIIGKPPAKLPPTLVDMCVCVCVCVLVLYRGAELVVLCDGMGIDCGGEHWASVRGGVSVRTCVSVCGGLFVCTFARGSGVRCTTPCRTADLHVVPAGTVRLPLVATAWYRCA